MTGAPVRVAVVAARGERGWLRRALTAEGTVVVAETDRPESAAELVAANDANVVVVDLGLEGDGGLHAIVEIMTRAPRPVLALIPPGAPDASAGLDAGALEAYPRPSRRDPAGQAWLRDRVRSLREISILPRQAVGPRRSASALQQPAPAHPAGSELRPRGAGRWRPSVLAALAGAPSAVGSALVGLVDVRFPLIVSVRLAPELIDGYTAFLSRLTTLRVDAAGDGAMLAPGAVLVASADRVVRVDADLRVRPAVSEGKAADELFASVATAVGSRGVGVLLAGTAGDGPAGLRALSRAGGAALVQDTAATTSSTLPHVRILPLGRIAAALREAASRAEA